MTAAVRIPVTQGSVPWLTARRDLITATDVSVILGVNPWRSEQDLADEKLGIAEPVESNVRMRIGTALEPLIAAEYEAATGRKVRRVHGLWRHPTVEWAGASPDFTVVGEQRLLETKWSGSRARFAEGLPEDIEAQATWQCFVSGYPSCDVAALVGDDLRIFPVQADTGLAEHMVAIAADFRRRLADGGPFAQSSDSIKRKYPRDNGAEMVADSDLDLMVRNLLAVRAQMGDLKGTEDDLETRIKSRIGEIASVRGKGYRITWRKTKDREELDYRALAEHLLAPMPEPDRAAVVGPFVTVKEGFRPFRVTKEEAS